MTVAEFATKRVVSTTMILLFMIFSGFMTMRSMKKELIPDFKFPMVVISTNWTGAASEDVKTQISKKIEDAALREVSEECGIPLKYLKLRQKV